MKEKEKSNQVLLEEIAEKLGTSVQDLLERYDNIDEVINKYQSGELKLLRS